MNLLFNFYAIPYEQEMLLDKILFYNICMKYEDMRKNLQEFDIKITEKVWGHKITNEHINRLWGNRDSYETYDNWGTIGIIHGELERSLEGMVASNKLIGEEDEVAEEFLKEAREKGVEKEITDHMRWIEVKLTAITHIANEMYKLEPCSSDSSLEICLKLAEVYELANILWVKGHELLELTSTLNLNLVDKMWLKTPLFYTNGPFYLRSYDPMDAITDAVLKCKDLCAYLFQIFGIPYKAELKSKTKCTPTELFIDLLMIQDTIYARYQ